ncbi:MAG: FAD-binding protein [Patescibacteria group bacterium]
MKTLEEHKKYVESIAAQMRTIAQDPVGKKINFVHGGTHSTRTEESQDFAFVDISNLNDVIEVNAKENYALVEPNVSLDKLLRATLEHDLIPQVIAEFPGITVGGAVNGASLESSSYRYGQFNDTAEEYEIVLANGEIVRASQKENTDLFYGISGSYGTLGLLTLIKLRLRQAKPYVRLCYEPLTSMEDCLRVMKERCADPAIDYVEAVVTDATHGVVITGTLTGEEGDLTVREYAHANDEWFYLEVEKVAHKDAMRYELVPIRDYLFRYNRGAFWMGEYFFSFMHLPHHRLLRFVLNPWMNTKKLYDALRATNTSQEYFVQDFFVPFDHTNEFIKYSDEKLGIYPLWLCPMKPTKTAQKLSPQCIDTDFLVDVGVWGQSQKYLNDAIGLDSIFETFAQTIGARKMLYARAYYPEKEFWKIYDYDWYKELRKKYHADSAFPEIWEKVHVSGRKMEHHILKGALELILQTIEGKNLNS